MAEAQLLVRQKEGAIGLFLLSVVALLALVLVLWLQALTAQAPSLELEAWMGLEQLEPVVPNWRP